MEQLTTATLTQLPQVRALGRHFLFFLKNQRQIAQ